MAFNLSLSNVNQGSPTPLSASMLNQSAFDDYQTRNSRIAPQLNDLSFKTEQYAQNLETSKFASGNLQAYELTLADDRDSVQSSNGGKKKRKVSNHSPVSVNTQYELSIRNTRNLWE